MARWFSNLTAVRHGWKGGGVYLVTAIVVFAGIVFFLFRGHSSGPQEAAADSLPPETRAIADPGPAAPAVRPAVETSTESEQVSSQQMLPPTTSQPEPQVLVQPESSAAIPPVVAPVAAGDPAAEAGITEALSLIRTQPGAVIEARTKLNAILLMPLSLEQKEKVKTEMAKLSEKWLFGPAVFPTDRLCDTYGVRPGDVLEVIGRRLKVPHEILMQINNIPRPRALQAGKALKVVKGPFNVKVYRSTFTMDLYLQDTYVRSFKVGLGKSGYDTPTGRWRVKDGGKLISPDWTDPDNPGRVYKASDPDYPLGSRWIALEGMEGAAMGRTGFAIHGTKEPEQIGSAGSRGCIRMYNGDAVLMYNLLVPLYSQVEVID